MGGTIGVALMLGMIVSFIVMLVKRTKQNLITFIVALILFFTWSAIIGSAVPNTTASKEEVQNEFMADCDTGRYDEDGFSQTKFCKCMLDDVSLDIGYIELGNILDKVRLDASNAEYQAKLQPYADKCINNQRR